jgi:hypothetical protein
MLAKPFGELFGEISPLLRIADGASSRRDRQHRVTVSEGGQAIFKALASSGEAQELNKWRASIPATRKFRFRTLRIWLRSARLDDLKNR